MWQVWLFDAVSPDIVPQTAGLEYFVLWAEFDNEQDAITCRNDLRADGEYARIVIV